MIKMVRLDERMIHGQIAIKWSRHLGVDRIIVADDTAAGSEIMQKSLMMAAPATCKVAIVPVEKAVSLCNDPRAESLKILVIVATLEALWSAMAPYWERLAAECKPKKYLAQTIVWNLVQQIPCTVVIFFGVAFGIDGLNNALAACPPWVLTGFATAGSMMTAVGFGILLAMIWDVKICAFYFVGFVCAKSLGLSSLGIAVIGATIAITIFFIEKNIIDAKKSGVSATPAVSGPANSEEDFF